MGTENEGEIFHSLREKKGVQIPCEETKQVQHVHTLVEQDPTTGLATVGSPPFHFRLGIDPIE